ncbi:MAG TPA: cysteine peptidase family C39 domain-containing protein [Kofleriaceae bacterium]|nr:cysteine peptidase family C39 domain-containing protein [Kofleriaceae bacterium]
MTWRAAALAIALAGITGCASYAGGARSMDPSRLATEPGWIVAAPTPALAQRGSHDCGAAALAMVAGRWHVPLSVDAALASLPAPAPRGARLRDLRDAARAHGLTAFAIAGDRATLVHELRAGRPVIVGLLLPYGGRRALSHYEVVVAVHPTTDRFVTIDPASSWRTRSWADLDAEWRSAGRPTLVVIGRETPRVSAARR